jgi:outer membrane protein TolC
MRLCFLFVILALTAIQTFAADKNLTLTDYLQQVSSDGPGYLATEKSAKGYELLASGANVLYFPFAFGNYTNFKNKEETATPSFSGDMTAGHQYSVGASWNSPIGLSAKYTYNISETKISNASAVPVPNYFTSYNKFEFTQSILKNGFGAETRAQIAALANNNLMQFYSQKYMNKNKLLLAEATFWRLAYAKRAVNIQKDALARATRLLNWAKRRVSLQLGDKSDLLQSQANFELRKLELLSAEEEEKNASIAFNNLRNLPGDQVPEALTTPSIDEILSFQKAEKSGTRLDVKAAEAQVKAVQANLEMEKHRLMPTLDVFANYALTGRDAKREEAIKEATSSRRSNSAIGVNVAIPLNVPSLVSALRGSVYAKEGAELTLDQKRLDEVSEWEQLQRKLTDSRAKLALMKTIEQVQKEKYENENQRLLKGRTTTYQALIFEQDYANTQLTSLRIQGEYLQLIAQAKLYRGEE